MKGLVTETKGRFVTVHIVRKEACGECRACLSGMMENDMDIEAQNLCEAEVGDWVELELQCFHARDFDYVWHSSCGSGAGSGAWLLCGSTSCAHHQ